MRGPQANALGLLHAGYAFVYDVEPGDKRGMAPSNMQPALAAAAEHGATGADEAWRIFSTRPFQPDYRDEPQFAIVPVR